MAGRKEVFLQLFSRLFTFVLNQALVRLATPQTFGTATVQFELLLSTTLFLSREGVRTALLRQQKSVAPDLVRNISLLPAYVGVPIAFALAVLYSATSVPAVRAQPYFHLSVSVYALAAAIELAAEPLYIRAQNELRVDVRVRAEGAAVFSKTLVTFVGLAFMSHEWALMAFAAGQAAYALATFTIFWKYDGRLTRYILRRVILDEHGHKRNAYFDTELLHLSRAMTAQSVVKHFLTEGDKFLISRLSPLADQGGYAVASNYGSLIARIVFQPIEESSRIFFSKSLTARSSSKENDKDALDTAAHLLSTVLLLFTHFLLLLVTFGPPYLSLATSLVLPPRYLQTSAPNILRAYRFYLPAMAYNGILEAFFASSRMMAGASVSLVVTAIAGSRFLEMGDTALVWANTVSMAVRALYAWGFVRRYCASRGRPALIGWNALLPPFKVVLVFAAAAVCTRWSAAANSNVRLSVTSQKGHIAMGGVCLVACLIACYAFERHRFGMVAVLRRR
ncbi:Rft-1-domain-containing protein [Multifurca ochricompacta]|uniref:Man(5)GlcNAc(2)-PP-dolichol translocation protein RFT1 n=1 Tax=Multifurca ochricompacta TaxID=376703 RepID=A0AAD4M4F0_9AGAM|nr:Rft-1-domain-containing protein [Multifurca ochricompacta]